MNHYEETVCARCLRPMETEFYKGCPHCRREGVNVNYTTRYRLTNAKLVSHADAQGIYRFRDFLPIAQGDPEISINEGNTPVYRLRRLGEALGIPQLYVKDESKNPTLSHKDRLESLIISKACADAAPGVVIASTGNQGASAAAYSATAGLPCVIFTTPNVSATMKTLMQAYGAQVFVTETMEDRAVVMNELVRELGYVPASGILTPPIGSSCFGVDGYKTIAYEIFEQMEQVPDWVIVPISYGDTLYGIYKGFCDLKEMGHIDAQPRMAAADVFGAAEASLAQGGDIPVAMESSPSLQTSIATGYIAYTTLLALRDSNGAARKSHDREALQMQLRLARTEGLYAEPASVASLVALEKLARDGVVRPNHKVLALITSTGLKDPDTTGTLLEEVPRIEPSIASLREAMSAVYGREL